MARSRRSAAPPASPAPAPASSATPSAAAAIDDRWWPAGLVLFVMLLHAVALRSELATDVPARNDLMFHLLMTRGASEVIAAGGNPLDFWIPQLELGFPQFLYYQHLPHLVLALIHRATFGLLSVETVFHGARFLLLVGMPVTVWWSLRRLGFTRPGAALAAATAVLFVASNRMGLEYNSYVTRGFGLFSQLVAVHLIFVVLGTLAVTLREGRGHAASAAALAALVLSHLLFGIIIAVMSVLLLLLGADRREWPVRVLRLAVVGTLAVLLASYMLIPFVQSSKVWLSTMPWLGSGGGGASANNLVRVLKGQLFDQGRLPALSLLVVIGLGFAWRLRDHRTRFAVGGLIVCTLVYAGRPDSGWMAALLPAHTGYVSYRFVSAVGVFAVLVIGLAGEGIWRVLATRLSTRAALVGPVWTLALLFVLSPALLERWRYYADQHDVVAETRAGISAANGLVDVLAASDTIGGRIYAGPVTKRACPMLVGPGLCLSDLLNARGHMTMGNPLQSLSLPAGLVRDMPPDDEAAYNLYDVRAVIVERGRPVPPFFTPAMEAGRYALYRVATSGVAQYVGVNDRRATARQDTLYWAQVAWLNDGGARTRQTTRWDYRAALQPPAPRARCANGGRTEREVVTSQSMEVDVRCDAAASDTLAVAFKMAFHPQWQFAVDGTPVQPYMVSPGYPAVDVSRGAHRITAHYRAHPAKLPLLLLGLAALAAALRWPSLLEMPVRQWRRVTGAA